MKIKHWIALALLPAGVALAVQPVTVLHHTQADFAAGETENVSVWNLGEVTLGREVQPLLEARDDVQIVTAVLPTGDGGQYVATGTGGLVLHVGPDGRARELARLDGALVTALARQGDRLLAATAGRDAGVYALDPAAEGPVEAQRLWGPEGVQAVWALAVVGETLFAATGPEGAIYAIDAAGEARLLFDGGDRTFRALTADAGAVYAGTTEKGLVYRIDRQSGDARVLLDSDQEEIVALALGGRGELFVAATDTSVTPPTPPVGEDVGRPVQTTAPAENDADDAPAGEADEDVDEELSEPADEDAQPGDSLDADEMIIEELDADDVEWFEDVSAQPRSTDLPPGGGKLLVTTQAVLPPASTQPANGPAARSASRPATQPMQDTRPASGIRSGITVSRSSGSPARSAGNGKGGNAVYRISPDGIVKTVVTQAQPILSMALVGPTLYLGTSGDGLVYQVDWMAGASAAVADLDPERITAIAADADGTIYAGTASPATLVRLPAGRAEKGTLISKPVDAKQIARWGQLRLDATGPGAVTIATRTGNTAEPTEDDWSDWSPEQAVRRAWTPIDSPAGRFLQYRLSFAPGEQGGSARVDSVQVVHQVGNLAPEIAGVTVKASDRPQARSGPPSDAPLRYRVLQIDASDANQDELRYDIAYRRSGTDVWVQAASDVEDDSWAWDTTTVPDGEYTVRVTAHDTPGNPPATALSDARLTRPITVDNTAPTFADLSAEVRNGAVVLTARVQDATSRLQRVEYVVNSGATYTVLAPADGIYDELAEPVAGVIEGLPAGPHVITVRAIDEYNNAGYASVQVTLGR